MTRNWSNSPSAWHIWAQANFQKEKELFSLEVGSFLENPEMSQGLFFTLSPLCALFGISGT
jgi:hypothetical protein